MPKMLVKINGRSSWDHVRLKSPRSEVVRCYLTMPFSESRMYGRRHYPVRNQTASLTTTCQKVSKSTIFGALGRIADFDSLRLQMAGFPTHVDIASWVSPNETRSCRTCSEAVQLPSWQSGISSLEICSKGGFVISCKGPRDVHAPQKHGNLLRSTDSNATDVIGSLNSKNKPTCHQCNQGRDLFLDLDIFERWSTTLPSGTGHQNSFVARVP
jgi:hypothetical protein